MRQLLFLVLLPTTAAFSGSIHRTKELKASGNKSNLFAFQKLKSKYSPGSELFPDAGSSYVPSGLTEDQWKKIQKKEKSAIKSKDLGAFGPRFAKSDVPSGDWMLLPKLWTGGFEMKKDVAFNTNTNTPPSEATNDPDVRSKTHMMRVYATSFLLLECLFTVFSLFQKRRSASILTAVALRLTRGHPFVTLAMSKITLAKLVLSTCLMKPISSLLKQYQYKFQENSMRIRLFGSFSALLSLFVFGFRRSFL